MFTLDPVIVQSRLTIVKAFREADGSREFSDVLDENRPDLNSLGALVQSNINKLYSLYKTYGITYEEFLEDLYEYLSRAGFLHRFDFDQYLDCFEDPKPDLVCGLDQDYPYSEVFLTFKLDKE